MKTTTIRELKHDTSTVLAWVASGESVEVRRHREPVAILSPAPGAIFTRDVLADSGSLVASVPMQLDVGGNVAKVTITRDDVALGDEVLVGDIALIGHDLGAPLVAELRNDLGHLLTHDGPLALLAGKDGLVLTGIRLQPLELLMDDTPSLIPQVLTQTPVVGSK